MVPSRAKRSQLPCDVRCAVVPCNPEPLDQTGGRGWCRRTQQACAQTYKAPVKFPRFVVSQCLCSFPCRYVHDIDSSTDRIIDGPNDRHVYISTQRRTYIFTDLQTHILKYCMSVARLVRRTTDRRTETSRRAGLC